MTPRILLALLAGVAARGPAVSAAEPKPAGAAAGATMPKDMAVARGVRPEFAPRGADSGVPGLPSYFHPFAMPRFVPFKRPARPVFQDVVQLVFLARTQPVRVEMRVTGTAGRSLAERWEANLKTLFAYFDRDADGYLNRYEADRIFSKAEFRQITQGGFAIRGQGTAPTLDAMDRDVDGRVSFEELADYYEADLAALLRPRVTAVPNYNQQVDTITPELFARFDADGDGKLTEAELKDAARVILALDGDEDECVTAAEILASPILKKLAGVGGGSGTMPAMPAMPGMAGPGAAGAGGSQEFQAFVGTVPGAIVQQVFKKYDRNNDFELTRDEIGFDKPTFDRLDKNKDGKLSATELDDWRNGPADLVAALTVGADPGESGIAVTPEKGTATVSAATASGRAILLVGTQTVELAPFQVPESARAQVTNPYAYAFPAGKEFVTEADLNGPQNQFLRVLFEPADRNGDGKLTRVEFDGYFALQRATGDLGVSVGHTTRVPNLFQLIDQNGDGKLSARELRTAYPRLIPLEPTGGKAVTKAILQPSVTLRAGSTLTSGFDQSLYNQGVNPVAATAPTKGPVWFRKMDRNGDGDVSRAEFLGTKEQFDAIDADRDGLVTLAEAEAFDKKARPDEKK